MQDNKVQEPHC